MWSLLQSVRYTVRTQPGAARRSVRGHAPGLDDLGPARDLLAHEGLELLGRAERRLGARRRELAPHALVGHRLRDLLVQPPHDGAVGGGRHREAEPSADVEAREAQLLHRRHFRRRRKSTRLNSSHANISYAVFCLKKKKTTTLYV